MKMSLEGYNSRTKEAEERLSKLEYKITDITQSGKHKKKRMKKSDQSLRDLWHTVMKHTNICIMGVLKEEKGAERISENTMTTNFPNFMKGIYTTKKPNRAKQDKLKGIHS